MFNMSNTRTQDFWIDVCGRICAVTCVLGSEGAGASLAKSSGLVDWKGTPDQSGALCTSTEQSRKSTAAGVVVLS